MSRNINWHNFENDALAPFNPCGILVQLYWVFLKGSVNDVNVCEDFSSGSE